MFDSRAVTDSIVSSFELENEQQTRTFAQTVAQVYQMEQINAVGSKQLVIYLQGDLGAGKSFFSRAFIQYFLPDQKVKSPTYTIVESYKTPVTTVHHFDLYRLCDPEELEYLAIRDLLTDRFVALIEWPQKGEGVLPEADILINLQHLNEINDGNDNEACEDVRLVTLSAHTKVGKQLVKRVLKGLSKK